MSPMPPQREPFLAKRKGQGSRMEGEGVRAADEGKHSFKNMYLFKINFYVVGVAVKEQPSGVSSLSPRRSWTPSEDLFVCFGGCFLFEYCFVLRLKKTVCIPGGLQLLTTPLLPSGAGMVSMCHACFASVTLSEWDQSSKRTAFHSSSTFRCAAIACETDHRRGPTPRAQPTHSALQPQHLPTLLVPGAL